MSVVSGILEEEENRLNELIADYSKILADLPNFSVFIRKTKDKSYIYGIHREGKKVVSNYIGQLSDKNSNEILELDKKRRLYKQRRKNAMKDIKEIRRMLGKKLSK